MAHANAGDFALYRASHFEKVAKASIRIGVSVTIGELILSGLIGLRGWTLISNIFDVNEQVTRA